ncbi:hypothetical protein MAR_021261 [Mya arenaria]|uniref:Uncharacterized protein n=1 Tax=Mya arenaria TaxID=6604 RepID=A0ABY7EAR7_MYAAR|nr:hypothetical protein MAR_021261 [Mya arenaria]
MMSGTKFLFVIFMAASMCLVSYSHATYIDCSMECLFAAFRQPTVCECTNKVKLHWGKRAPRTRSRNLPTFRYGKRSVRLENSQYDDRLNSLRSIQDNMDLEALSDFR